MNRVNVQVPLAPQDKTKLVEAALKHRVPIGLMARAAVLHALADPDDQDLRTVVDEQIAIDAERRSEHGRNAVAQRLDRQQTQND